MHLTLTSGIQLNVTSRIDLIHLTCLWLRTTTCGSSYRLVGFGDHLSLVVIIYFCLLTMTTGINQWCRRMHHQPTPTHSNHTTDTYKNQCNDRIGITGGGSIPRTRREQFSTSLRAPQKPTTVKQVEVASISPRAHKQHRQYHQPITNNW